MERVARKCTARMPLSIIVARGFLPTESGGRGEAETGRQQAGPFKKRV